MSHINPDTAYSPIYGAIARERDAQDRKWGEQNHPDGTGPDWAIAGQPASVLLAMVRDTLARATRPTFRLRAPGGEPFESDGGPGAQVLAQHGYDIEQVPPAGATWLLIAFEEILEVFVETAPAKLRAELVQVAAVAVAWIEAIDRRAARAEVPDVR